MIERKVTYFVSDVHLGLDLFEPKRREEAFVNFLHSINKTETSALYMLGDIWDFWYEYKNVVPKGYSRVFAALLDLIDEGVKVYFCQGNHDIWCYSYFQELGIEIIKQPHIINIEGKTFCLGHGDGLGPGIRGYKLMRWLFHNPIVQKLFSLFPPRIVFAIGNNWSKSARLKHSTEYVFDSEKAPLYIYAQEFLQKQHVDYFIFGHFHQAVDMPIGENSRFYIMKDWLNLAKAHYLYFDGISMGLGYSQNIEK